MSVTRRILGVLLQPALFALLLFAPAGTWAWWRAWVSIGVLFVATVVSLAMLERESPALLEERFRSPLQPGQPCADKLVVLVFAAAFVSLIAFIPEDVFRLHVSGPTRSASSLLSASASLPPAWCSRRSPSGPTPSRRRW